MASKYSRFTPIFAEWGALGSFVLLGDIAAQNLEHHFKDPKLKPSPVTAVPTAQAGAPITPENVIPFSSLHSQEHICKKEDMHHSITAFNSDDGDDDFHLDYTRLSAAACTGLMWVAPICMLWFPFLHRFMGKYFSHLVEGSFRYVSFKVILENACLAAPVCVGYFAIPAMIEGGNEWWSLLVARLQTDFVTTLTTDVSFWCVASPFNYKFIPVRVVLCDILFFCSEKHEH